MQPIETRKTQHGTVHTLSRAGGEVGRLLCCLWPMIRFGWAVAVTAMENRMLVIFMYYSKYQNISLLRAKKKAHNTIFEESLFSATTRAQSTDRNQGTRAYMIAVVGVLEPWLQPQLLEQQN